MPTIDNVVMFDEDSWKTMQMLKGSLGVMSERNKDGKFTPAIEKEQKLLKEYIQEYKQ